MTKRFAVVGGLLVLLVACDEAPGEPDAAPETDSGMSEPPPTVVEESETYEYDAAGRLIRVTYAGGLVIEYAYDSAGNRLSRSVGER